MRKILIFSLAYHPYVGGAEIAIKEITDRIPGIEWHMVTLRFGNEPREEKIGAVTVHRVGGGSSYLSKIFFVPHAALRAAALHRGHRFDGAWAMMSYMLLPLVLLRFFGIRIPYALTLQEGDTYGHMFERLRIVPFLPLLSIGFRNASVVQVISTYLGGWARRRGYRGTLEVIPNGYTSDWFSVDRSNQNRQIFWKNQHGITIDESNTILITTSRLVWKNAVDDVIKAVGKLPSNVHFMILGKGEKEIDLRKIAAKTRVSDRVHFLGEVSNTAVAHHLSASDIFIRPSRSEGMGNSFIEAMAAGIPVIATQEGGIADFLFDPERNPGRAPTGRAVNVDDPEGIARAVRLFLEDKEMTSKIVENAQKLASEKYDWKLIAEDMRSKVFGAIIGN